MFYRILCENKSNFNFLEQPPSAVEIPGYIFHDGLSLRNYVMREKTLWTEIFNDVSCEVGFLLLLNWS